MKTLILEIKTDDDFDEVDINEMQEKIFEIFKVNAVSVKEVAKQHQMEL